MLKMWLAPVNVNEKGTNMFSTGAGPERLYGEWAAVLAPERHRKEKKEGDGGRKKLV